MQALECRRRAREIAEADRDFGIVFLISPNLTSRRVGLPEEVDKRDSSQKQ